MIRKLLLLLVSLLLCGLSVWADAPVQKQASANDLVEWLFQRPLNCVEIQVLSGKTGSDNWTKIAQSLDHPTDAQRATLLQQFKADSLPYATMACQLDTIAHREIAPGLQFQSSEAFAEWLLFGMAVLDGGDITQVLPGPHFRDAVQATLVQQWPTLSDHYKEVLTGFPTYWANMRKAWPTLSFEAKNVDEVAWQNNLANVLQKEDIIRLASASLQDLQDTMLSNNPTSQEVELACQRVLFAAYRLRRPDIADPSLADQLTQYVAQARKQESGQIESAELLQKMDVPKVLYSNIWTDDFNFPGYWGGGWGYGWGAGYPYWW